jgi:hypothetical protein
MFRILAAQPIWVIVVSVISASFLSLLLVKWSVKLIARDKMPLSINSPLPGIAATTFVFIAAMLAAQIQGDITESRHAMYREVAAIHMIRIQSEVLPTQQQAELKTLLQGYVNLVAYDEWKKMQYGDESIEARVTLSNLLRLISNYGDKDLRETMRSATKELINARMERLRIADDTVPFVTWIILCSLAFFTMVTLALNHYEHIHWQRMVGITSAMLVSLIFILLLAYDQPYAHPDFVAPQTLLNALR